MRKSGLFLRQLVLVAGCAALPALGQSQTLGDVSSGSRVQLIVRDSLRQGPVFPARQIMVGQFVRATTDSVWIRPTGAAEFGVARREIKRASVSRGASRLRSALTLGAQFGFCLAVGVALERVDGDNDIHGRDVWIASGVGLGAGLALGALSPYEHWRGVRP